MARFAPGDVTCGAVRRFVACMEIVTSSERPDLESQAGQVFRVKRPEFIFHDPIAAKYHQRASKYFATTSSFSTTAGS